MAFERDGYRKGQSIDHWKLEWWLGGGGNGNVWRAVHHQHGPAALKILKRGSDPARRQRFSDEIAVMREHRDHPGVLRLIADSVPVRKDRAAWHATAIAEPLLEAMGQGSELLTVVDAFASFARTLADLAEDGVSHRDIKPDNLFRLDESWVLGDFGLADFPGKETVTKPGRRLGPMFFIAPEMLSDSDTANGNLADVYSLAKSLWAVATDNRYPPGGQIRAELSDHRVGTWFEQAPPGSLNLTLLLERATTSDPSARPTIAEFAERLSSWSSQTRNVDDLAARELQRRAVDRLGDLLATSLDPGAAIETQQYLSTVIPQSLAKGDAFRRDFQRNATAEALANRESYLEDSGVKGILHLCDSPWPGSLSDGHELARVVLDRPPSARGEQLLHLRQVLLGRPLWWMEIAALVGLFKLLGEEGCEDGVEMTRRQLRRVLLEFPDEPGFSASYRMQRAMIPVVARMMGLASVGIQAQSAALERVLIAPEKLMYDTGPENLARIRVDDYMRTYMRADPILSVELRDRQAQEAAEALDTIPLPTSAWFGPADDPWLISWQEVSPLLRYGLHAVASDPGGDVFIQDDPEMLNAVNGAATGPELLKAPALTIVSRLAGTST